MINTLYLSRVLEPKEFAIFGSIISISLVISGIFTYSQARFLTEGVRIKDLDKFSIDVVSIALVPLLIFLLTFFLFGEGLINENLKKFLILISVLIICNLFKNFFLNYSRIKNNYKNYFFYYIYDKLILFTALIIFIFTNQFELFIKIYCLANVVIIIFYFFKLKKINFDFIKDIKLIKSSKYNFFLYSLDYLVGIHVLIFIMTNIGEYEISSSITLGLTIYSLIMIPLAFLETFLGPIIAKIFKQNNDKLFNVFIDKNLINYNYLTLFIFLVFKIFILEFNILEFIFPKYIEFQLIIFSVTYLVFYSFIKFYFWWFFNAMNRIDIILKNTFYQSVIILLLFILCKSRIDLFIYFYILTFLTFSLYVIYSFNNLKHLKSFYKIILINTLIIFDFTIFYFFEEYQHYSNLMIIIFLIIFYYNHRELRELNLRKLKIK